MTVICGRESVGVCRLITLRCIALRISGVRSMPGLAICGVGSLTGNTLPWAKAPKYLVQTGELETLVKIFTGVCPEHTEAPLYSQLSAYQTTLE